MDISYENIENKKLIEAAHEAKENAYVPYSGFHVGAALLTDNGGFFDGCNIENSSYGATVCAERAAVFAAVARGERHIRKIAVVSDSKMETPPCGICRQVMSEFMAPDAEIILENENGPVVYKLSELLPNSFGAKDMK